jgi:hypothetical protein
MRKVIEFQMRLGEVAISSIEVDLKSRDEIPKVLIGLQKIYCNPEVRERVFSILERIIPEGTDTGRGRPGMDLWKILVLGTLRLICNWDFDKLQEIANHHLKVREMLLHIQVLGGHIIDDGHRYALQTLMDNISLLTPEVLDEISKVVVEFGHEVVGKGEDEELKGSCDSFVVETNVEYPTDVTLLFEAMRKAITLIAALCVQLGLTGWRKSSHNLMKLKQILWLIQHLRRSKVKDEKKKAKKENEIKETNRLYIKTALIFLERVKATIKAIREMGVSIIEEAKLQEIERYVVHAERQIDQIRRRALEGEKIPHDEKVFSIFEEHTEWIVKGKAGVSQELGVAVCILKDQYGFTLAHEVMEKTTDEKIALSIVTKAREAFTDLRSCSFDKGFYTPDNVESLGRVLDGVILPKKGKLSEKDKEREHSEEFVDARRKHSAVESAINALENHGLDRCRDHGIHGFKRYVSLAILARNIQIIGHIEQQKALAASKEQNKRYCLAA